ncbi:hypothetical protein NBZ79_05455 [Sneathiella marina]|uniref:Uncharacterized protein n=1 Tax=Sneathiella marina TaxID=2950108 RepID=A0ABY4W8G1_9PROT|nr:hypothetical protein [Sneathiella marina]USG62423.1 hypothetical protein NBZ79_05455 [Sneathiella marina]
MSDQALSAESKRIKGQAFDEGRALNNAEIERRKSIAATRMELADALEVLGISTIDALENSDNIDILIKEIDATNQQLEDDLARLKIMVEYAEIAAKVAEGLATAATKIASL